MINNTNRIGYFTSSNIYKLVGTPKPRATYIQEKKFERKLGRSLNKDESARPLNWGKLVEGIVFNIIGPEYSLTSQDTIKHPTIENWSGSPDGLKNGVVMDIKCPYTMKSFCELAEICENKDLETFKKEYPEYYWQLVSNAILLNVDSAELIVYCPYKSELAMIRDVAQNVDTTDQFKYYFIAQSIDDELPFILDGGYYKNLNFFEFEVPVQDKEILTQSVIKANLEL